MINIFSVISTTPRSKQIELFCEYLREINAIFEYEGPSWVN